LLKGKRPDGKHREYEDEPPGEPPARLAAEDRNPADDRRTVRRRAGVAGGAGDGDGAGDRGVPLREPAACLWAAGRVRDRGYLYWGRFRGGEVRGEVRARE